MKTCIITGASSGIGQETALQLSQNKQFEAIAILGRNKNDLDKTKNMMDIHSVFTYYIDLSRLEEIPNIIDAIYKQTKSIDCLLNIAGYTDPQPLLSTTLENMKHTYEINVFAPFILMRECARYMKKKGGKILNVASTAGMTPRPGWLSYASSKASIISMSQTLSEELAEYGIQVYCISPGRCATRLRQKLAPDEDPSTIMQPSEVAKVICDLVAENECCLDGQNIVIRKQMKKHTQN